eukprot:scaffold266785_cov21-Tisochrysis_lutea.AAC.1
MEAWRVESEFGSSFMDKVQRLRYSWPSVTRSSCWEDWFCWVPISSAADDCVIFSASLRFHRVLLALVSSPPLLIL